MKTLSVFNPANAEKIADLPADDAASVAEKFQLASTAQKQWAQVPFAQRLACLQKFRTLVQEQLPDLATIMTLETGKPIQLSHNELNGFLGRLTQSLFVMKFQVRAYSSLVSLGYFVVLGSAFLLLLPVFRLIGLPLDFSRLAPFQLGVLTSHR